MKQYGKVIAKLRKQKGLTQQELGKRLNVSYQAVSKWENDLSEPDLSTLQQMVDIFEISIADFFAMAENKNEKIEIKDEKAEKTKSDTKVLPENKTWYIIAGLAILVVALMFVAIFVPFRLSADRIYKKVSPSVFSVKTTTLEGRTNYGTGFFINDSGLAVTDYSVINNCESGIIKQGEKEYNIKTIVGVDRDLDVAIIKIDIRRTNGVSIAKKAKVADRVYAISCSSSGESSLSETLISKVNYSSNAKYYQITTSANDGSAVVNEQGKVVGMISSGYSADAGMDAAIPIERILKIKRNINISPEEYFNNPFTLTFLNSKDEIIATTNMRKGSVLGEFAKTGYIVSGVYNDKNFTSKYNLKEEITSSKIIYVDLRPIEYTINFLANGGSGTMVSQHFKYDEAKPLSDCQFYISNKMLSYWLWNNKRYDDKQSIVNLTTVDGDVLEFKAIWTDLKYTITFDANGGSGTMSNKSFLYNEMLTLPSNSFTKLGHDFVGWEYNGYIYKVGDKIGNLSHRESQFTFKAVWTPKKYTIKYVIDSTTLNTYEATFGEDFILPDCYYKNQVVDYLTYNGKTYNVGDVYNDLTSYSSTINFDVTLKGVDFKIKYILNDTTSYTYDYTWGNVPLKGTDYELFVKEGYTFSTYYVEKFETNFTAGGYFTNSNLEILPDEILELKINWTPITYRVTINNRTLHNTKLNCTYDVAYTVPDTGDYLKGHTLENYSLKIGGEFVKYINIGDEFINLVADTTTEVVLEPNYIPIKVNFNYYVDGEIYLTEEVEYGEYHTMPKCTIEKEDKWFNGWMLDGKYFQPNVLSYKYYLEDVNFTDLWSKKLKGEGNEESPYLIETFEDLASLTYLTSNEQQFYGESFKLVNDIDCQNQELQAIRTIGGGVFDGNYKVIKNVKLVANSDDTDVSLFGFVRYSTIKNLGLENFTIDAVGERICEVAPFCSYTSKTTIENCWAKGSVNVDAYGSSENYWGLQISGFCRGVQNSSVIKNCYSQTEIRVKYTNPNNYKLASSNYTDVSGFVSYLTESQIENCYSISSIDVTNSTFSVERIGEFYKSIDENCIISNCFYGYYEGTANFLSDKIELEKFTYYFQTDNDTITKVTLQDLYNLEYLNINLNFDLNVWKKNEEDFPTLKSFGESV